MRMSLPLQEFTSTNDDNGNVQKTWIAVSNIYGTCIPTANVIWSRAAGIIDDVDYNFFTKSRNAKIIKGNRFIVKGEPVYIDKVFDYGKVLVIGMNNALRGSQSG